MPKSSVHKPLYGLAYRTDQTALKPKHAGGRPTTYNFKKVQGICWLIQEGNSLARSCELSGIPYRTVVQWLRNHEEFALEYAYARQVQADYYADSILEVIDNAASTRDEIERAKIKAEALKWIASKLKPRSYGDKLDLTSAGERIETPIYGGLSVAKPKRQVIEAEVIEKPPTTTHI